MTTSTDRKPTANKLSGIMAAERTLLSIGAKWNGSHSI